MIFRIRYGHCWRVIYRGAKEYRERWLQIIVDFQCCFLDIRTGAPWRDLPPDYGGWSNTHRRFIRWHDKGIWEKLLEILIDDPDYEWLMIDASHCKVHPHASGARGGNQDMSRTKGGSTPKYIWLWMRMVC
ncbi:Putative transposase of IS4/5 family [Nitrosomonas eutropha]|nr:Putative transposase of IS4/5 family [Nitrosomonas eutropha]